MRSPKIGFEAEIIFTSDYDRLYWAAIDRGDEFIIDDDSEIPAYFKRIIAQDLSEWIGSRVVVRRTQSPGKNWAVVAEDSICPKDHRGDAICAVEITSPPLSQPLAKEALGAVFAYFNANGGLATEDTGLHLNIDVRSDLDPLSFALTFPEERWLRAFGRMGHPALGTQREHLAIEACDAIISGGEGLSPDFLRSRIGSSKAFAINFDKLAHGYLELRHCGGRRYPDRLPLIQNYLSDALLLLEIAAPAGRKSVRKKLDPLVSRLLRLQMSADLSAQETSPFPGFPNWRVMLDGQPCGSVFMAGPGNYLGHIDVRRGRGFSSMLHVDTLEKAKLQALYAALSNPRSHEGMVVRAFLDRIRVSRSKPVIAHCNQMLARER